MEFDDNYSVPLLVIEYWIENKIYVRMPVKFEETVKELIDKCGKLCIENGMSSMLLGYGGLKFNCAFSDEKFGYIGE